MKHVLFFVKKSREVAFACGGWVQQHNVDCLTFAYDSRFGGPVAGQVMCYPDAETVHFLFEHGFESDTGRPTREVGSYRSVVFVHPEDRFPSFELVENYVPLEIADFLLGARGFDPDPKRDELAPKVLSERRYRRTYRGPLPNGERGENIRLLAVARGFCGREGDWVNMIDVMHPDPDLPYPG